MDPDEWRGTVRVSHDEGNGRFGTGEGSGQIFIAGDWMIDHTFESEDPEVSPARGKVSVGHLAYACERHGWIIRFDTHSHWSRTRAV